MAKQQVLDMAHAHFPKTYRESYWGAVLQTLIVGVYLWATAFGSDPNVIYALFALFPFTLLNLIVTRTVLYDDSIESIGILGRRSLFKADIARLEIREAKVRRKNVERYLLISRNDQEKPLTIPGSVARDAVFSAWMQPIATKRVTAGEQVVSHRAAKGAGRTFLVMIFGFMMLLTLPLFAPPLKPYFDLLLLFLPWIAFLSFSRPFRTEGTHAFGESGTTRPVVGASFSMLALFFAPIYLLVVGRGPGTFVVSADSLPLTCVAIAMALASLALIRLPTINTNVLGRDILVYGVVLAGLYGYGAAATVNELFDKSVPETFPVGIESKFIRTGKGGGNFFKVAPWGPETIERDYRTSRDTYARLQVSDTICASLHSGAIGMRWYQLSDSCR
jgi:hypothetical protein